MASIGNIFNEKDDYEITNPATELKITNEAKEINIEVDISNILIKKGDTFKIETANKYIESKQEGNKISIIEKDHNLIFNNDKYPLLIYIPTNTTLEELKLENGVGTVYIEELSTKTLTLKLGVGKVTIDKLIVYDTTKIDGGAGETNIKNSFLNNLDLNMGIGKFSLTTKLSGNSKIDHGVGELNLNLIGDKEDYQISLDKGIGTINLDNRKIKDNEIYGTGSNKIEIDGGVVNININFKKYNFNNG